MSEAKKIVFLCGKGESSTYVYNGLKTNVDFTAVITENAPNKRKLFNRRLKNLGWLETLGQVLFILTVPRILLLFSSKKKKLICAQYNLDSTPIDLEKKVFVESVNSNECIHLLEKIKPDLIIVNGTRIINSKVLNSVSSKFINSHVGITPKYRGVHGGYWAIANNDELNFGVTVHEVDTGIDTGKVLYQKRLNYSSSGNFVTYPLIQTAGAIKLLLKTLEDFNAGRLSPIKSVTNESKLWYHPTLWSYLFLRITKGVK